ncbi:MAG: hypothetical protein HZC22_13330 [Rhodocyclales bacterium]|nr:hypothetical protein [Rhodocyclales bacterium]
MLAPTTFRAGDSISWIESLPAYPASAGWALKFRLIYQTGAAIDINAAADGDNHKVDLAATATAAWVAGSATLAAYIEKGTERITLASEIVTILPNLATATNLDSRSIAARSLADALAARAAYLASGKAHVAEYDIAGRVMKFRSVQDITDLIEQLQREVSRERAMQAVLDGGAPGRVQVRF